MKQTPSKIDVRSSQVTQKQAQARGTQGAWDKPRFLQQKAAAAPGPRPLPRPSSIQRRPKNAQRVEPIP